MKTYKIIFNDVDGASKITFVGAFSREQAQEIFLKRYDKDEVYKVAIITIDVAHI